MSDLEDVRRVVDRLGEAKNRDIVRALGVSAASAQRLLHEEVRRGTLERRGRGPATRYRLRTVRKRFRLAGLEEDRAWGEVAAGLVRVRPLPPEEARSLQYAANETINNAIEHSRGRRVEATVEFLRDATVTTIRDDGVGAFRRMCQDFGFASPHEAIVQLEKGKLTSDPSRHSGEGLFFTSKVVSRFRLESQQTAWVVDNVVGDTGIGGGLVVKGTRVVLEVVHGRTPRLTDVFAAYTDPETLRFDRTRTTVRLGAVGSALFSRSEARRLVQGLSKFARVTLDFSGVDVVGQGFCDEVFRVFAKAHPEVALEPVGMNEPVAFMVGRAVAAAH